MTIGFSKEEVGQSELFEASNLFAPDSTSPSSADKDFGTGLSMAKCFTEQLGGVVGLEGNMFTFCIPAPAIRVDRGPKYDALSRIKEFITVEFNDTDTCEESGFEDCHESLKFSENNESHMSVECDEADLAGFEDCCGDLSEFEGKSGAKASACAKEHTGHAHVAPKDNIKHEIKNNVKEEVVGDCKKSLSKSQSTTVRIPSPPKHNHGPWPNVSLNDGTPKTVLVVEDTKINRVSPSLS